MAIPSNQMDSPENSPQPNGEPIPLGKPFQGPDIKSDRQAQAVEMTSVEFPQKDLEGMLTVVMSIADALKGVLEKSKADNQPNPGMSEDQQSLVKELEMMR